MQQRENVDYTVVLVSAGFGAEQENAEEVIEAALEHLNTYKDEPGFRFAYHVSAHLERVQDAEEAEARLQNDDSVAMMILHGLEDDERIALTRKCIAQTVPVCRTLPAPDHPAPKPRRQPGKRRGWEIRFRKRSEDDDEPHAHSILETTLTGPLDGEEEEIMDRVGQLVAVMALGVMEHHWTLNPPQIYLPE